jgi:hypothetical protein
MSSAIVLVDIKSGDTLLSIEHSELIVSLVFSPDGHYLASAEIRTGDICIWDVNPVSSTFRQCFKTLYAPAMNCRQLRISDAMGLDQEMSWRAEGKNRKGKLLEFLADRGAVLDDEQQKLLVELRKQRETRQAAPQDRKPTDKPRRRNRRK